MKIFQSRLYQEAWSTPLPEGSFSQLVLAFGSRTFMRSAAVRQSLKHAFPNANVIGCTTSGEIMDTEIYDESLCVTAIEWEKTPVCLVSENISFFADSRDAGAKLAAKLDKKDLKHVFVLSDGQHVNGTLLVEGISAQLPEGVVLTGGLAGDDDRFEETWVWHNDRVESGLIVLCGLYGDAIRIGHGSLGGWDTFGPDRKITRSEGNVLYELDNQSALELYKQYLGEHASELPASALRFPLSVHSEGEDQGVVRTILNINEEDQSMVFAGDMPEGSYARLMHANFDRLIDGANNAAEQALESLCGQANEASQAELGILISCVGRRLVLKQQAEEELDSVRDVLADQCALCGFYSYGEISPLVSKQKCSLHNQTMTITTFTEVLDA